jgi:hypothetical protein
MEECVYVGFIPSRVDTNTRLLSLHLLLVNYCGIFSTYLDCFLTIYVHLFFFWIKRHCNTNDYPRIMKKLHKTKIWFTYEFSLLTAKAWGLSQWERRIHRTRSSWRCWVFQTAGWLQWEQQGPRFVAIATSPRFLSDGSIDATVSMSIYNLQQYQVQIYSPPTLKRVQSLEYWPVFRRLQNCEKQLLVASCLSVCMSVWNNSGPTGADFDEIW